MILVYKIVTTPDIYNCVSMKTIHSIISVLFCNYVQHFIKING